MHGPAPPAQPVKPDSTRLMPISMTVGPVTMGGKILSMIFGGKNEMKISTTAQIAAVPMRAPYPCGHGSFVPSAAVGQNPLLYICVKAPVATVMMAKEIPTTEIRPVPM